MSLAAGAMLVRDLRGADERGEVALGEFAVEILARVAPHARTPFALWPSGPWSRRLEQKTPPWRTC
jgi:hypothetical protein